MKAPPLHGLTQTAASLFLILSISAHSAIITFEGDVTINHIEWGDSADLVLGDTFYFELSYDDSATNTSSSTTIGRFDSSVTHLSLTRDPGNVGAWDPEVGILNANPGNISTFEDGDRMGFDTSGTGIPAIDGESIGSFSFFFRLADSITVDGTGETLNDQFGGMIPDYSNASTASLALDRNDALMAFAAVNVTSTVPEPSSALSFLGGSLACGLFSRRRKSHRPQRPSQV